ncbi:MAG: Mu transposase C-terminal domain-containing protein [Clostridiales bacterium]|jgi:transposase InsO family protein|nr:Mu transposase C-terminal domain-containing protein [Clostridiales bacterium]
MEEKTREELAQFKYKLLEPILTGEFKGSNEEYYRMLASKPLTMPDGKTASYKPMTFKSWHMNYRKDGLAGLYPPKSRSDLGSPRALNDKALEAVVRFKHDFPYINSTDIYKRLLAEGIIAPGEAGILAVMRFMCIHGIKKRGADPVDRRTFEMARGNELWEAHVSEGPVIGIDKTFLVSIMDDYSRLVVGAKFYFDDTELNAQETLKSAVLKYGVPQMFHSKAESFNDRQLKRICATLGATVADSKPYDVEEEGKLDRFYRIFNDRWLKPEDFQGYADIESLNQALESHAEIYNNREHSETKAVPRTRWLENLDAVAFSDPKSVDEAFLHRATRKVSNVATIIFDAMPFEVPFSLRGKKVEVRYKPEADRREILVYSEEGEFLCAAPNIFRESDYA